MEIVFMVITVICTIAVNRLYHKLFDVTYFGCRPFVMEWFICLWIGGAIAAIPFHLLGLL